MDIRIRFTKKWAVVFGGLVLCGLIGLGCWNASTFKVRQEVKATCQGECGCFNNVVDYRLTDQQVRLFDRFVKELQVRKTATILEFMDASQAVTLQQAFAVCQQRAVEQPKVAEPTQAPKTMPEQPVQGKKKTK